MALLATIFFHPAALRAQGTAFSYEGQLNTTNGPATGLYDLAFSLYTTKRDGNLVAGPVINRATGVTNGMFSTTIDFGPDVFNGPSYWLEIAVQTNGGNGFVTLSPRQSLLPVPYAMFASSAATATTLSGSLPASQITGTVPLAQIPAGVITNGETGVNFIGTFSGNGLGLTNVPVNSLAWTTNFGVVAWGDNDYAEGTVPPAVTNVAGVSSGYAHTLALLPNGTVTAWGENTAGDTTIPAGLSQVTQVAAGGYHSLALKNNGMVVAWGDNTNGQTTVPAGLSNVVAVAAGGYHSLALKSNGTVAAWGDNSDGQIAVPAGLTNVAAVAGGYLYSAALKSNGTVTAWGYNYFGQTSVPAGLTNVVAIAAGSSHVLALKANGTVVAWGDNAAGQTRVPAGLTNVVAIAAGAYQSLALLTSGQVMVWGDNSYGQLNVPVGLSNVVAAASGCMAYDVVVIQRQAISPFAALLTAGNNIFPGNLGIGGTMSAVYFSGGGGGLTGLNASQLSAGTVPLAQLPPQVLTNGEGGVTLAGSVTGTLAGNATSATSAGVASNVVAGISITNAFITSSVFAGNGAGLTNLAYASLTGKPAIPATNGFVTAAITNGLATTNFVITQGYLTSANGAKASLATNVVSGISITNGFITNSVFAGDGAGLANVSVNAGNILGSLSAAQLPSGLLLNGTNGVFLNAASLNTAFGFSTLANNAGGSQNSAFGYSALLNDDGGMDNSAFGYSALYFNTGGSGNSAFGSTALVYNADGAHNSAFGYSALFQNISGSENSAFGGFTLSNITNGVANTAIGSGALFNLTAGTGNLALGEGAGTLLNHGSGNIYIGNPGIGSENGTIRIGSPGAQTVVYLSGAVTAESFIGDGSGLTNVTAAQIAGGVIGGLGDTATGQFTTAVGGLNNSAGAGEYATVIGGGDSVASGQAATVAGGYDNQAAGDFSFAAGENAQATNTGSFVWADSLGAPFASTGSNTFNVRATGGVVLVTAGAGLTLDGLPVLTAATGASLTASQMFGGANTFANADNSFNGSFAGDGSGLLNLRAASITGILSLQQLPGNLLVNNQEDVNLEGSFTGEFNGSATYASEALGVASGLSFINEFITNSVFAGDGSGLTNLNFAQIAGSLSATQIGAGTITSNLLAPGAVTTTSLAPGAVANNQLVNSSFTIKAGAGLAGGGPVALGGSVTLNNSGVLAVTGDANITAASQGGVVTLTDNSTSANAPNTLVVRDSAGSFSAGKITAAFSGNGSALTGLNASQLTSGTVPPAQLPAIVLTNHASGVTFTNMVVSGSLTYLGNGSENTALGIQALAANISGTQNSAVGTFALLSNTSGNINTALGDQALTDNLDGNGNTAMGYQALNDNTSGSDNTAIGLESLATLAKGSGNVALGYDTLAALTSGNGNIAVGQAAGASLASGDNNIYIGNLGSGSETGIVRIGTPGTQTATYLAGTVYANGVALTSDRNAKENFAPVDPLAVLAKVTSLPVTEWNYKSDRPSVQHMGPMAQDFQAAFGLAGQDDKHISVVDEGGVALAAIQGLNQMVEARDATIQAQSAEIQTLKQQNDELAARLSQLETAVQALTTKH